MKKFFPVIVSIMALISTPASAELYKVKVKRLDQNIYKVVSADIVIKTRYCYVYTYGDDVVIDTDSKKIIFINQSQTCEIEAIG